MALKEVKLAKWELPTQRPTVLIVQLRTRYREHMLPLLQPEHDSDYEARLFAALDAAVEQQAHITVFPEYAWPKSLVPQLRTWLEAKLAEGYACVLPFEHTLLSELSGLLEQMGLGRKARDEFIQELDKARGGVAKDKGYCNFLLFAVKVRGELHLVPQAKLSPAAFEEPSAEGASKRFIGGSDVRRIQGRHVSVAMAICFDFIARDEALDVRPRAALHGAGRPDLFIVPECNPSPLHASYARGLVALYADPSWARQPPVVIFANVAAGTQLPQLRKEAPFGSSRVYGRLGNIGPQSSSFFREFAGVVANRPEQPAELDRLPHPTLKLLAIRQQESAVRLTLPALETGPTRDPEAGRIDTEVVPLRYVAQEKRWQRIHPTRRLVPPNDIQGIPAGLLAHARRGVHIPAERDFDRLLRQAPGPLWVQGPPGSGKSMLAAIRLHEFVVKPGLARVVWLDLGRVDAGSVDKLQAGLLLALGKPRALQRPSREQWEVIQQELSSSPTVLVLDSFEWWSRDGQVLLPEELRQVASWPGRLVLTTRGGVPGSDASIKIAPLDANQAHVFLSQEADQAVDRPLSDAVHRTIGGLPLALSWVAGLLRAKRSPEEITTELAIAEQKRAQGADGLEELLKYSTSRLPHQATQLLGVLALLPAPAEQGDLAEILGLSSTQIEEALRELEGRNLVLREPRDKEGARVYGRHPIVRQFGQEDAAQREHIKKLIADWALRLLDRHGGDLRWKEFPHLWRRWENLRVVLGWLAESSSRKERMRFLEGWRKADYALWSGGRWRDRSELGRKALTVASKLGKSAARYEAHAAYDSVAETEYHLNHDAEKAWPLFDRAEALLKQSGDRPGLVMVDYYRGRVLRQEKKLAAAREYAVKAEKAARKLKDERLIGLVLNLMGKIDTDEGKLPQARQRFSEARQRFQRRKDSEMEAVVDRNEGRLAFKQGLLGEALDLLERSMSGFQELQLEVEAAETANHHAQVLAKLRECDEAEVEFRWARGIIEELGAKVREDEFRQTEQLIAEGRKA
jgi:DNA-binding MarR family transcriptional regulator